MPCQMTNNRHRDTITGQMVRVVIIVRQRIGIRQSHEPRCFGQVRTGTKLEVDFRHAQAVLKKTTNGFMAQVMETEVPQARTSTQATPSEPEGIRRDWENSLLNNRHRIKNCQRCLSQRDTSRVPVLGFGPVASPSLSQARRLEQRTSSGTTVPRPSAYRAHPLSVVALVVRELKEGAASIKDFLVTGCPTHHARFQTYCAKGRVHDVAMFV